ncbi:MAG: hypothetical protein ACLPZY_15685 [Terracidiphilus sp.]
MKFVSSRAVKATRFVPAILLGVASLCALAQAPQAPQPADQTPDQSTEHHGQVIFSRSADENGQSSTTVGPAATNPGGKPVNAPVATDDERQSVTFTAFDLDVHLHLDEHQIAVRALVTVRNDGATLLAHVPLQISSSLAWERIRIAGRDTPFTVATLNSDVDHTGQLHEAAIALAQPLAPGASLQLDVTYSGVIELNGRRLTTIGTPDEMALHSDWDQIGAEFTGLRGFGDVVWYPASGIPVILGDGARVFDEMGEHKLRMSGAHFRLHLAAEFPHGQAPTVTLINGELAPLSVTDAPTEGNEVSGVATASADTILGFDAPSIFLAIRTQKHAENTEIFARPEDEPAVEDWSASAAAVSPFLRGWLGEMPRSTLAILDLPDPEDAPFETGSLLVTAIRQATPEQLDGAFAHALTHAWLESPRAWVSEGVANFMGTLWIEHESGRKKALESLESGRAALALAEPASPGESAGQPLGQAIAPVYYREKATYIFWMLRDLIGDAALSAAFRAYTPSADAALGLGEKSGAGMLEKLLEKPANPIEESSSQAQPNAPPDPFAPVPTDTGLPANLSWFFADWVDADKGLPDLSIGQVFAAPTEAGNWLVTVNIANAGYASVEVPLTVSTPETSITQRVFIPGHDKAVKRILLQGQPTQVTLNDGVAPETQASVHVKTLGDTDRGSSSTLSAPTQ